MLRRQVYKLQILSFLTFDSVVRYDFARQYLNILLSGYITTLNSCSVRSIVMRCRVSQRSVLAYVRSGKPLMNAVVLQAASRII